jgi:hypothetical protein
MKGTSRTNWKHLEEMPDEAIETIPPKKLVGKYSKNANFRALSTIE